MSVGIIFIIALAVTIAIVLLTWIYAVKIENFSIIDSVWASSFFVQSCLFYCFSDGTVLRKILFLLMVGAWGLRLGIYLGIRIGKHHPLEDTRYQKLREEYGEKYKMRFFIFYMYQALSVSFLTFPFIYVFKNSTPEISILEWIGFGFWAIAVLGEALSDHQMNTFKSNLNNKGKVCNIGLWKYSRHPNYFFESLIWWGFFIFIVSTNGLWWSVYAPLTILFLLLKVTGVPPSEQQSLKNRGEAYREYQKTTSAFVPWFPRKS